MSAAKQDPQGKHQRMQASDGKVYFSYAQIHQAISSIAAQVIEFNPDVIIAIGGGGFIPARMLRTQVKVPILAVSVELYDDRTNTKRKEVTKCQWFDETSGVGSQVRGKRVLIMDEVDDTRTTLKYVVEEVHKTNAPSAIAVAVVHNKLKPKDCELPDYVELYLAGEEVQNQWNCYPWDSEAYGRDIMAHEELARICNGEPHIDNQQTKKLFIAGCVGMLIGFVFSKLVAEL